MILTNGILRKKVAERRLDTKKSANSSGIKTFEFEKKLLPVAVFDICHLSEPRMGMKILKF